MSMPPAKDKPLEQDPPNAEVTADAAPPEGTKVVEYIGVGIDERVIRASDWKGVGAEGQGIVKWDRANGFKVDASTLSDKALEYLAKQKREFKIVES